MSQGYDKEKSIFLKTEAPIYFDDLCRNLWEMGGFFEFNHPKLLKFYEIFFIY